MPNEILQVLDLDGHRLEVQCARRPGPLIVLINGAGGPLAGWMRVWQGLTGLGTVVAWNRPGIGASDAPRTDQTSDAITRQLKALLDALGLPGPCVVLGHSLGGLHAMHLARRHPGCVAAAVLLEATAPADVTALPAQASSLQRGVQSLVDRLWPPDRHGEAVHAAASAAQVEALPPFPPVPLAVVTGVRPALGWLTPRAQRETRRQNQSALAGLSPHGRHILAHRSGHFPQLTEPNLVVQVVAEVARAAAAAHRG